jgi:hypothetical protein
MIVGTAAGGSDGYGLAWFAPFGTTAPVNESGALNAAFKDAGLITEDGLTLSMSESSNKIKAYGSQIAQRTIITDQDTTFSLKFLEHNPISMAVYYRKTLTAIVPTAVTGAFSVTVGAYNEIFLAMVLEIVDGSNRLRGYCPKVSVTNREDLQVGNGAEISLGVELTAYPVSGTAIQWFGAIPSLG